jgi:hypothetical protein
VKTAASIIPFLALITSGLGKGLFAAWLLTTTGLTMTAAENTSGSTQTLTLEYREAPSSHNNFGLQFTQQNSFFKKEPDLAKRDVYRGKINLSADTNQVLPFLWDYSQGTVYLDLNGNGDLTDDPKGIHALPKGSYPPITSLSGAYCYQTFPKVALTVKTTNGNQRSLFDLNLHYYQNQLNVSAGMLSYWSAQVTLQGQDWEIGITEYLFNIITTPSHLLLRPWKSRNEAFNTSSGSLDSCNFPRKLFFNNQAYELTTQHELSSGTESCTLTLKEISAKLGDLNLTGQHIRRVYLSGGGYSVILEKPAPQVKVPVATYNQQQVLIQQGTNSAHPVFSSGIPKPVIVQSERPATLNCGGPLTNSVSIQRRGRVLVLNYQLLGADHQNYQTAVQDRSHPPTFKIYQGDRVIASGKFEYG